MADRVSKLQRECNIVGDRARSLRIRNFRWELSGDRVTLDGDALTPEAIDSAVKLFEGTAVREVVNHLRHTPPDPSQPGAMWAPDGYVQIVELGPHGSRLAETQVWEVVAGDTLESIAAVMYGDTGAAARIREANVGQTGPGGFIRPGQKLRIPPA